MKKIILALHVFCFLFSMTIAQQIEWQNTIGGIDFDYLYTMRQTADGGYILGGTSYSNISGDKTENNADTNCFPLCMYTDYWIVKTDAAGNIQWQNTIGGTRNDILWSIEQTSDGGYIMGGYSSSNISADKSENNWDPSLQTLDYWIVKTDASGNIQWDNTIGGSDMDYLQVVKQTSDGGYILGGMSSSNISGDKTENMMGGINDYWIVKTDGSGNIQWQNTIGGNGSDELYSLQQTSDGGYIFGGRSSSDISGDKTENTIGGNGSADYWIVKTDVSGNIQWQHTIGGNSHDFLYSLQQTTDGGYILGGWSNSNISGNKTKNCNGYYDYWIVKTDLTGNVQWDNTFGGDTSDFLNSIWQTIDGGYIIGGSSRSNISGDKTENSLGGDDYWMVKTDASGNIQWQNTLGGSDQDELNIALPTADNSYILGGQSRSNISGDKTENTNGGIDIWIVKYLDKYNSITGKLFIDGNSNSVQDAGEPDADNNKIIEINNGRFTFSKPDGAYNLFVADSGNFTVSSLLNYYNAVPSNQSSYFPGFYLTDSLNDFAFQPAGVYNDLCITITPLGNFRANMNASYMINYENVGTTTLNGTVIFFPDNDITFVSANPIATSVTTDSVVWNVGSLTPFQTGSILVTVHVNIVPIGTLINSSVRIEPVAGDANTACNYNAWEVFVTGSFDPNAILVDRDTVLTTELSSPPFLEYIIYFQNTGNDTAFNVRVLNPIDTFKLEIHSFEFVASSHPVNIEYKIWEKNLHFTFDNILLPDSNINEPASHGFIKYRIKPFSTLAAGDSVKNNAAIYFDFNQPVMTDTVVTEIVLPTNLTPGPSPKERGVALAPNPVINLLSVFLTPPPLKADRVGLVVYDLFGREVFKSQILNPKSQIKIDVSHFLKGIYFVQLNSGEQVLRGKFLKE